MQANKTPGKKQSVELITDDDMSYLRKELLLLQDDITRSSDVLRYSLTKCQRLQLEKGLSPDELESFEALTSSFARLSDMIIQKAFRLIDAIDLEDRGTVRDRINRAEKKGLIQSADDFIEIRILRNEIAHEYKTASVYALFAKVMAWTPKLLECVARLNCYMENL